MYSVRGEKVLLPFYICQPSGSRLQVGVGTPYWAASSHTLGVATTGQLPAWMGVATHMMAAAFSLQQVVQRVLIFTPGSGSGFPLQQVAERVLIFTPPSF